MALRAFPFMALWFYGSVVLWFCGLVVIWPRSAPVLASARPGASLGHDFMAFSGFSRLFCPPTLSLGESTQNLVGLYIITRAIYHKILGDVPSMLTEICRIVPKWSPTPVPPPPCPALTFPDFRHFSDFFAHRPCPLVSLDLKLCVIGHH